MRYITDVIPNILNILGVIAVYRLIGSDQTNAINIREGLLITDANKATQAGIKSMSKVMNKVSFSTRSWV
ncbi:hypothetical protein D3C71_2077900 [compost metagenome]